ncbi:GTP cyclohydrolase I FolE [Algoriphagus marincola]|uniref:GTP cyclohydrolase 1 n=1 Tax=Algoriphagus marincola TaxID=264027 RepID=A0ABS7N066_9BACT|nr:GTP cyclohydrolase I FolE [Algoriphagus marincola]MBY5949710.1 GTP cyclohydrolase I FolE [Algoriphagus marincola]
MKQKETMLTSMGIDIARASYEELGEEHLASSVETPLREDAFEMDDDLKVELIEKHFKEIMNILGLDLTDDSLKGTPHRVAKMYVKEVFAGLNPKNKPVAKLFENKFQYNQMLVEKDITFFSHCEHHFVPIYGRAHVAYISNGNVIGLSKINRIVQYYSKRPQVQERLSMQIGNDLKEALGTDDVAVIMDAYHMCVSSRGINDTNSSTVTSFYSGKFDTDEQTRNEFLKYISLEK